VLIVLIYYYFIESRFAYVLNCLIFHVCKKIRKSEYLGKLGRHIVRNIKKSDLLPKGKLAVDTQSTYSELYM